MTAIVKTKDFKPPTTEPIVPLGEFRAAAPTEIVPAAEFTGATILTEDQLVVTEPGTPPIAPAGEFAAVQTERQLTPDLGPEGDGVGFDPRTQTLEAAPAPILPPAVPSGPPPVIGTEADVGIAEPLRGIGLVDAELRRRFRASAPGSFERAGVQADMFGLAQNRRETANVLILRSNALGRALTPDEAVDLSRSVGPGGLAVPAPPQRGKPVLTAFAHGIARMTTDIVRRVGDVAEEAFPGLPAAVNLREGAKIILAEHPEWTPVQAQSWLDLIAKPEILAQGVGEVIPFAAAIAAGGTILAGAGGPGVFIANVQAAHMGQFLAAAVVEGHSAYEDAKANGATELQARTAEVLLGGILGAIEMLQFTTAKRLATKVKNRILNKAVATATAKVAGRSLGKELLQTIAMESLQETIQGSVEDLGALAIFGKPIEGGLSGFLRRRVQEASTAAVAFPLLAGAGGVVGGISQAVQAKRIKATARQATARAVLDEAIGETAIAAVDDATAAIDRIQANLAQEQAPQGVSAQEVAPEARQPEIVAPGAPAASLEGVTEQIPAVAMTVQQIDAELEAIAASVREIRDPQTGQTLQEARFLTNEERARRDELREARPRAFDIVDEPTEGISDAIQERQAAEVPVQEEAPSGEEVSEAPTEVQEEVSPGAKLTPEAKEVSDVQAPAEPRIQAPEGQAEAQAPQVEDRVTGLANAQVEQELAERELRPARKGPRTTAQGVIDNAQKAADEDPFLGSNLVKSFQRNMRPASVEDIGVLLHERTRLISAENAASNAAEVAILSGSEQSAKEATNLLEQLQAELQIISDVSTMTGTEQGQAFWARKLLVKMDFSLAGMLRARTIANEGPLSKQQRAQIVRLQDQNAKLEQQIADRIEEVDKLQRDVASKQAVTELRKPRPRAKGKWGSKNRLVSIARADKARKLLNSKLTQLNVGLDPEMIKAAAELALFNVEAGVTTLAEFAGKMLQGLSKKAKAALKPHLDNLWKNAQGQFAEGERDRAVTRITDSIERGAELTQLAPVVKDLARSFVIDGIDDLDALVDAVHGVLVGIDPNITRKEANELLAGYGRFRRLDKSETEVELRRLRREALETAKLQDALEGQFPKKTGGEQQAPSDLARLVQKKTQEAIKEQGLEPTDPETQLKSFRASKKTRLANEISALEDQLATKERLARGQRAEVSDPEITALTRQRDSLKEQFDAMFAAGIEQETLAKRRRTTERALEKQLKELERRRDTGDLFPDKPKPVKLRGKKLDALRAKVEAVKAELDELKSLDPRSEVEADARALKSYKTRTTNRIADLRRRIAEGDFDPKPTRKVKLDKEATRLQFERSQVLAEYQKALWEDKRRRRGNITKVVQFTGEGLNVGRAFISSYDLSAVFRQGIVGTVSHPLRTIPVVIEMLKALRKQSAFEAEQKIRARELFPLAQQSGVEFTEHGTDLAKFEEAYQSRWAERIPGVAASERAFVTFLNRQRMDMFEFMIKWLTKTGEPTSSEARAIAAYVNIATGKSSIKSAKAKAVLAGLSAVLWSPKLQISRFQFLTLQAMYGGTNRTRKLIALEYARFLGGLAVVYATWIMAGGDLEADPRSSDFLKLRVKDTRIDPLGGFSQMIVFFSRIISGSKKTLNGKVVPIRGEVPYGSDNTWDIITRFARSKLSPGVGAGVNIITGTNVIGEDVTPITITRDLIAPMAFRDIFEAMRDLGFPVGMIPGALAIFGIGIQSFKARGGKTKVRTTGGRGSRTRTRSRGRS